MRSIIEYFKSLWLEMYPIENPVTIPEVEEEPRGTSYSLAGYLDPYLPIHVVYSVNDPSLGTYVDPDKRTIRPPSWILK